MTPEEMKKMSDAILLTLELVLIEKIKDEFRNVYKINDNDAEAILAKIGMKLAAKITKSN